MKNLQKTRRILLIIILLILVAIPTIAAYFTITGWDGICYGFTDGSWACPWTEYFGNQLGYAFVFAFLPLIFVGGFWLALTIIQSMLKKDEH
jgi:hypothetical protein